MRRQDQKRYDLVSIGVDVFRNNVPVSINLQKCCIGAVDERIRCWIGRLTHFAVLKMMTVLDVAVEMRRKDNEEG